MQSRASSRFLDYLSKSDLPPSMSVEFKKMTARVPTLTGEIQTILDDVSGRIECGQLVALMGPSGAGKSTLLNVLGCRFSGEHSGEVLINGHPRSKKDKRHIGYVLQKDLFLPNLTVKETLSVTASLRLSSSLSQEERQQRVDDIISAMGLTKCQHTQVQLVSGGESKRVSIANELLINPSIIFLDEPLSGLDSASAFAILSTLQELCKQGRTVVCAIHQPSSQMFAKFDSLALMASGKMVYFGAVSDVLRYFENLGYECPVHYNPADFVLDLVTDQFATNDEDLGQKAQVKQALIQAWSENPVSTVHMRTQEQEQEQEQEQGQSASKLAKYEVSWARQFQILYHRAFKHRRGHIWSWLLVLEIAGIAGLSGLVWWRIEHTEENINDYTAANFMIMLHLMFAVMFRGVIHFPLERDVVRKERQSGSYRVSAYYLSKILAEFPVDVGLPLIACSLFYWFVGMADDFFTYLWYLVTVCAALFAANSFGVMAGCSVASFDRAITLLAVAGMFMIILSGFLIKDRVIPDWIGWLKYFSFMRYGYLSGLIVCLNYVSFECGEPSIYPQCMTSDSIDGLAILEDFGIQESYAVSMLILLSLSMLWFLIGFIFLRKTTAT